MTDGQVFDPFVPHTPPPSTIPLPNSSMPIMPQLLLPPAVELDLPTTRLDASSSFAPRIGIKRPRAFWQQEYELSMFGGGGASNKRVRVTNFSASS